MSNIIDVHAHIVFQDLNNEAGIHGPEAFEDSEGRKCFKIGEYVFKNLDYENSIFTDIDLRMDVMSRLGVDLQVLSPNPLTMFHGIEADTAIRFCKIQIASISLSTCWVPRCMGTQAWKRLCRR